MDTVQNESLEQGETRTFKAAHPQVVAVTTDSLRDLRLDVTKIEDNPQDVTILFVRPISAWQWGAAGRVVVKKSQAGEPTPVTVNYTRRLGGGLGQESWARAIFTGIETKLVVPAQ